MPPTPSDQLSNDFDDARASATRRAESKVDFFRHLVTYAIVIGALCVINLMTAPNTLWVIWPAAGWGIGLVVHAVNVFLFSERFVARMTERELHRQR